VARSALMAIEKRLKGVYSTGKEKQEKQYSTANLVQALIQDATDLTNLVRGLPSTDILLTTLQAKMYPGWAAWH
jgi:serine/threonine-protein kinase ATR